MSFNEFLSIFLLLEKRSSPQQNGLSAGNQIGELKGSPPAKKIVPRRMPTNTSPLPQEKLQKGMY